MKKVLSLAVIALALASCKKDYTCTCTNTSTGSSISTTNTYIIKGVSKGVAKAACVSTDDKDASGNVESSSTCDLSK